jgi:hypothetical protein
MRGKNNWNSRKCRGKKEMEQKEETQRRNKGEEAGEDEKDDKELKKEKKERKEKHKTKMRKALMGRSRRMMKLTTRGGNCLLGPRVSKV